MKTAISLPDQLFRRADELAAQLGIPRSQLYARAVADYLDAHEPDQVTAALDAVYSAADSSLDTAVATAQSEALAEGDW